MAVRTGSQMTTSLVRISGSFPPRCHGAWPTQWKHVCRPAPTAPKPRAVRTAGWVRGESTAQLALNRPANCSTTRCGYSSWCSSCWARGMISRSVSSRAVSITCRWMPVSPLAWANRPTADNLSTGGSGGSDHSAFVQVPDLLVAQAEVGAQDAGGVLAEQRSPCRPPGGLVPGVDRRAGGEVLAHARLVDD